MKKFILGKIDRNIKKDSYIWNMTGGLLNAFQSVFILMVLSRVLDVYTAGVFTIAWAIANLMITIGKYGIRNFQVTDVNEKYTFNDYFSHRIVASIFMIIITVIYVSYLTLSNEYPFDKMMIVYLMCYLKLIEAVEDVFHGMYQQHNRLDVAGKCMTIRIAMSTVTLCVCASLFKSLLIASIITNIITTFIFLYLLKISYSCFNKETLKINTENTGILLKECLPIFLGSFLSFYILNAPKYAIDSILTSKLQAYYGYISMPVFVVGLLNNFIFQPILTKMAISYEKENYNQFIKLLKNQVFIIIGITLCTLLGSYLLGIPVLSILYNCNLDLYRTDLCILMLGGGMLAFVGFLTTILTLMREQEIIVWGYVLVGIIAFVSSNLIVKAYRLRGASLLYLGLISLLALFFLVAFIIKYRKKQLMKE